jgi:hypothetical protein
MGIMENWAGKALIKVRMFDGSVYFLERRGKARWKNTESIGTKKWRRSHRTGFTMFRRRLC